jgi:hypothetical protein
MAEADVIQPANPQAFDGCNVCRMTLPHVGLVAERDANARLIAAAPDLLKELKHLVALMEPLEADGRLHIPGLATVNGARAAIAKAEPQQPTYTDAALASFGCPLDADTEAP